jgi:hypothetical protein
MDGQADERAGIEDETQGRLSVQRFRRRRRHERTRTAAMRETTERGKNEGRRDPFSLSPGTTTTRADGSRKEGDERDSRRGSGGSKGGDIAADESTVSLELVGEVLGSEVGY